MTISKCYVWKWLPQATRPVVAGELRFDDSGRQAFAYGRSFLERENAESIYPGELELIRGTQLPPTELNHFPSIRDAAPDAWGRRVIQARLLGQPDAEFDSDLEEGLYLMESGSDRIGSLDFQSSATDYVAREQGAATLNDLKQLHDAAELVARRDPIPADLQAALFHGTAIGGARPKAGISDQTKKYIAKFSLSTDTYDMVRSEHLAMLLASRLGLHVAKTTLERSGDRDVLLVERFDREKASDGWCRRSLVSGLTILGLDEKWAVEATYKNLVEQIRLRGDHFARDARELFGRMVFNVLIGNTDDHARNHSFFVEGETIRLTPAYDICAFHRAGGEASHGMKLFQNSNLSRISLCVEAAADFGMGKDEALNVIETQIKGIVSQFESICTEIGMSPISRKLLWRRAVLNPDIFADGYDHMTPKEA